MVYRGIIGFIAGWVTWRYWWEPTFGDMLPDACRGSWSPCYLGWIFAFALLVAVTTVLFGKSN